MSPYAVQIAYLKSLIIILESMDQSQEEDINVSIGMLNEIKTNMGKLIKTLQEID